MIPAQAKSVTHASRYAWVLVAMLVPVAMLNYLDRTMLATMRTSIRADIPSIASDQDFGLLMSLFMWIYAFLSPVGGFLADRFNRRYLIIFSLFTWSAMTWLTGHVHTFQQMAWVRAFMGISEAFYIPAALALIADFHPDATRSRAIGFHTAGIYLGQTFGGLGGYIADTSSWRNAFYWFGAAGMLYSIVLIAFLKESSRNTSNTTVGTDRVNVRRSLLELLGTGSFLILVAYFTLPAISGWAVKNWLPTYLGTAFNLRQGPAGMSATGFVTLACFGGALLGGALADLATRRTPRGRIYVSALGTGLCVPALLVLGHVTSLPIAIAGMIAFGAGFGCFDANNMPILCQIVKPEFRATGYGIMNLVSIGVGAAATVAMGAMRDRGISLGVAFELSAAIALLGGVLVLFVRPRYDVTSKP